MWITREKILFLGISQIDEFDDTTIIVENEYSIGFTEQQKKFSLNLHYNGSKSLF